MSMKHDITIAEDFDLLQEFLHKKSKQDFLAGHMAIQEIMEHFGFSPEMFIMHGKWYTSFDIAKELNISIQKVGRIINKLNLKDNTLDVRCAIVKINPQKNVLVYFYSQPVIDNVARYIAAEVKHNE